MQTIIVLSFYIYWTPLRLAAENGHLSVVEYLINQKADKNTNNKTGYTPLGSDTYVLYEIYRISQE